MKLLVSFTYSSQMRRSDISVKFRKNDLGIFSFFIFPFWDLGCLQRASFPCSSQASSSLMRAQCSYNWLPCLFSQVRSSVAIHFASTLNFSSIWPFIVFIEGILFSAYLLEGRNKVIDIIIITTTIQVD